MISLLYVYLFDVPAIRVRVLCAGEGGIESQEKELEKWEELGEDLAVLILDRSTADGSCLHFNLVLFYENKTHESICFSNVQDTHTHT